MGLMCHCGHTMNFNRKSKKSIAFARWILCFLILLSFRGASAMWDRAPPLPQEQDCEPYYDHHHDPHYRNQRQRDPAKEKLIRIEDKSRPMLFLKKSIRECETLLDKWYSCYGTDVRQRLWRLLSTCSKNMVSLRKEHAENLLKQCDWLEKKDGLHKIGQKLPM